MPHWGVITEKSKAWGERIGRAPYPAEELGCTYGEIQAEKWTAEWTNECANGGEEVWRRSVVSVISSGFAKRQKKTG